MGIQSKPKIGTQVVRDGSSAPISFDIWPFVEKVAPTAFLGGTTNARGDDAGTSDPFTLFNVTGDVIVSIFGVCTVDLVSAGGGTLEVGVTGNTAGLIAQTTATAIDLNEVWRHGTPALGVEEIGNFVQKVIVNGLDIIESVGTADITAGNIYYICGWYPLSYDGSVVAAV